MHKGPSIFVKLPILVACLVLVPINSTGQAKETGSSKPTRIGVVLNPDDRFFLIQKPIYNGIKLLGCNPNSDDLDVREKPRKRR